MVQPVFVPQQNLVRIDAASTDDSSLWVRAIPLPGEGSMSSVFSTVHLGADHVTVIDPGWIDVSDPAAANNYLADLDEFLRSEGRELGDVDEVVVTHAHPDHIGAAATLLSATGARYAISAIEQETIDAARNGTGIDDFPVITENTGAPDGVLEPLLEQLATPVRLEHIPDQTPDALLHDGDTVCGFQVVLTPGHTPGHLTLVDDASQVAIIADHILPDINAGAGLGIASIGGNPVADYLHSLRKYSLYDAYLTIPGHGFCFTGLGERRRFAEEHVLARATEVRQVVEKDPQVSVWDLAAQLTWTLGWEGMVKSPMLVSGLRQVMMYRELVRLGD